MRLSSMLFVFIVLPITLTKCGEANDTVSLADSYMADPEAVKRGRLLFVGTCAGYCHKLTPERIDALYLFDCEWKHGSSDQAIFDIVTTGVPNTRMVGFGTNFPEGENDLWKIIAFIRTNSPQCA
ncbi:MAG: c-type cytochrome [Gammaproteobacteria bacterium]|jgi:mono/diheme cytochrome c family protein|nr:c-type cytochrome [Gammaproteobacteria bacterium]